MINKYEMNNMAVENKVEELFKFISSENIQILKKLHEENLIYVNCFKDEYVAWKNKLSELSERSKIFQSSSATYRELEAKTNDHLSVLLENTLFTAYEALEKFVIEQADTLEEKIILRQEDFNFKASEGNNLILRSSKKIKSAFFAISRAVNKPFRKNKNEYSWNRTVPLKNLYTHYLIHNLLNNILKILEAYVESAGQTFIRILNQQRNTDRAFINHHIKFSDDEEDADFEKVYADFINNIESEKSYLEIEFDKLADSIKEEIELQHKSFQNDYRVIGTIELPKGKFKSSKIKKELSEQSEKLERSKRNYQNFISSVFERIEFHQDLFWFSSLLISNSQNLDKYVKSFSSNTVKPIIDNILKEIKDSIGRIENTTSVLSVIKKEKNSLTKSLDQTLIPNLLNKVTRNNAGKVLQEYSKILEKHLNEFDKEYTFVKPKSLTYRLKLDQIKKFSPKDIISPIVLKKLSDSTQGITKDFNNFISKQNSTIIGLGRIIEYNLDSALVNFKEENSDKKISVDIAIEGLSRAINKSEEYQDQLVSKTDEIVKVLDEEVSDVLHDLLALSNIDRLITIKIQVSKEKAIQEAKTTLQNYYVKFSKWFIIAKNKILNLFSQSKAKIVGISSKVGLSSTQMELSEAMADYLVRVSESLEKLPYVYRRLFSNEQLSDERIFIGREDELARLEKAVNYWLNDQISSVMMIGEKGSGTSSLLNIVINKFDLEQKIFRRELRGTLYEEKEFLSSFKDLLQLEDIKSIDDLIDKLNGFDEKRIIIIENIEDLFLRVTGGFKTIKLLLEIITATNNKILWITTCNLFAWQYLKKVLNINDYFTFNIRLNQLSEELLERVIMSRHNISGYELEFVPTESIENSKSYSKLNEIEKHEYLKNEYFEQLHKLSVNNIGVALFIWLRSIVEFDEEKIKVNSKIDLDYSFLSLLSDQKLFSLMAIILHDGLRLEEHALIFNNELKESQLLFSSLADDGIIFKRNDIYKINFQLYNPIIALLKDKNILH